MLTGRETFVIKYCHNPTQQQQQLNLTRLRLDIIIKPNQPIGLEQNQNLQALTKNLPGRRFLLPVPGSCKFQVIGTWQFDTLN